MDMSSGISTFWTTPPAPQRRPLPPEVYVRIRKTPEEYLISVRNRVREDLLLGEGKLPGTAKRRAATALGLANVQDVLRKYGAEYTVSCRDRWFGLPTAASRAVLKYHFPTIYDMFCATGATMLY